MAIKAHDYLIIRAPEGRRMILVEALADEHDEEVFVLHDKHRLDEDKRVEETLSIAKVAVNLGSDPPFGTVYGCEVEPYRRTVSSNKWGEIHFYRRMDKKESEALREAFKKVRIALEKKASTQFLPLNYVEVRNVKGKYAGTYHFNSKLGDFMRLRPSTFEVNYLCDLLFHECGHGVWYRLMGKKIRARWVLLYANMVQLSHYSVDQLETVKDKVIASGSLIDVYASLDEDEANALNLCIAYMQDVYSVSYDHIDSLVEASILPVEWWPTHALLDTAYESPIGDYAAKSVEEFFAESFRFFMLGHKLPKVIQSLMDKTIQRIR